MKRKIFIISSINITKIPQQRIIMEKKFLEELGFSVDIIYPSKSNRFLKEVDLFFKVLKKYKEIKSHPVIVYDLITVCLFYLYTQHEKIIAEIIDDFPSYYIYKITKKIAYLRKFKNLFINILDKFELQVYKNFCKALIVNSKFLYRKYASIFSDEKIFYIPYTSPFEKININKPNRKKIGLLYLGHFSYEKGADEILKFFHRLKKFFPRKDIKLYIFGNICYSIPSRKDIIIFPRLYARDLIKILNNIKKERFLLGLSFIKPLFRSYAYQDANKDIDYLAMGIPIVGNYREPTKKIIKEGGGVFFKNISLIKRLISSISLQNMYIKQAQNIYRRNYSSAYIKNMYKTLLERLLK